MPPASRRTARPCRKRATASSPVQDRRSRRGLSTGLTLGGLLTILLFLWWSGAFHTSPSPDVLLISVDTLRVDHLGLSGYDRPTSPEIDALGRSGIVFTQAICQNTNTNPSHASILSGLYPRTHGNWDNFYLMNHDVVLLPQVFRKAGYRTAAFVSGYTLKSKICALDRGFDIYDDDFSGRERRGDQTTDLALKWMEEHASEPFFIFVHLFDPHGPYDPPDGPTPRFQPRIPPYNVPLERIPRYQRLPLNAPEEEIWTDLHRYEARYDGEIAFADAQVGRLLHALKRLSLERRTIVLLTSDH
ncbi:MAG: sulfatase, partial [Acidobacteriota bacterium]